MANIFFTGPAFLPLPLNKKPAAISTTAGFIDLTLCVNRL